MFTRRKFLSLSLILQHKTSASLLRRAYDALLQGRLPIEVEEYNLMQEWMQLEPLSATTPETLSDRYHRHLATAGLRRKEHNLLPIVKNRDRLFSSPLLSTAIYLDSLRSAHNVGSIMRTVEAFALGTLYLSSATPNRENKQVRDTAMGTADWISCYQNVALTELPKPCIALETSENAFSLYDFIFPTQFTLVIGNEEYGCSEATLREADFLIEIPQYGRKNSLNAANAFAIVASEIRRQKNAFLSTAQEVASC